MSIDPNLKNLLTDMKRYMLIDDNISLFKCNDNNDINKKFMKIKNFEKNKNQYNENQNNSDFFYINKHDKLFWCFYIIKYGYDKYEINKNNSFSLEKNIKIDSIEKLREKKDLLKINKLKLNEIENELVNEKNITIKGFIALCIINELNIFYVGDNVFYEYINNTEKETFVIKFNKKLKKLGLYTNNNTNDYINKIKESHMLIFDITKQIKGLSSYKLGDLQEICKQLKLTIVDIHGKNLKKNFLYESILIKLKEDSINNIS